ncbi:hypothetical protein NQ317_019327 [Molorchus minor]|uniref:Proteasome subunit beta type-4 n=1 Tax=Molorchus minor TaxID=1323400 RepID=A0ABQ9IUF7_9CUCU|nr:hypothetical protein NQ317_019327 [Molorchus minor]
MAILTPSFLDDTDHARSPPYSILKSHPLVQKEKCLILWIVLPCRHNGPTPGLLYNFPATQIKPNDYFTHTQVRLITTATSVVVITYKNGVIMAGDLLASYGSLASGVQKLPGMLKVNDNTILGLVGTMQIFSIIDEECLDDGLSLKPKSLYCWLTRIMYQRRSKFDPFWNNIIVAGNQEGKPFLGTVDKLGTAYTDKIICTCFGAHILTPLLRDHLDRNPNMSLEEAKALLEKCMEVLYYRDARSYDKYLLGYIDLDAGVKIEGPFQIKHSWEIAHKEY